MIHTFWKLLFDKITNKKVGIFIGKTKDCLFKIKFLGNLHGDKHWKGKIFCVCQFFCVLKVKTTLTQLYFFLLSFLRIIVEHESLLRQLLEGGDGTSSTNINNNNSLNKPSVARCTLSLPPSTVTLSLDGAAAGDKNITNNNDRIWRARSPGFNHATSPHRTIMREMKDI